MIEKFHRARHQLYLDPRSQKITLFSNLFGGCIHGCLTFLFGHGQHASTLNMNKLCQVGT